MINIYQIGSSECLIQSTIDLISKIDINKKNQNHSRNNFCIKLKKLIWSFKILILCCLALIYRRGRTLFLIFLYFIFIYFTV